jgi:hypothetical protein
MGAISTIQMELTKEKTFSTLELGDWEIVLKN